MELTGKQRAQLRAMANELEPIVHIGKGGITDNIITAMEIRKLPKKLRALQAIEDSLTAISDEIGEEIYIRASDVKDRGGAGQGHPQRGGAGHRHEIRALSRDARQAQGKAHRAREG